jgi:hypothetical protein
LIFNILGFQFFVFYIICFYIKIIVNRLNHLLKDKIRDKKLNSIKIIGIIKSFDSIYSVINEYNNTFWSKFLFVFWVTLGSINVLMIYMLLMVPGSLTIKLLFSYTSTFWTLCFLFIIFTASSVNYSVNKSYISLNSLIIYYSKNNKNFNYNRISTKIKVI